MVQQAATERFVQLAGMPSLRGIRVRMEGRTAILTGADATECERRISQLLVKLEPGVRTVEAHAGRRGWICRLMPMHTCISLGTQLALCPSHPIR